MPLTDLSSIVPPAINPGLLDTMYKTVDANAENVGGTAAWIVFGADGTVVQNKSEGYVCNSIIKAGAHVFGYQTARDTSEAYKSFYGWLLNRSWAAPFINSRGDARDLGFFLHGDTPSNVLVAILTLQRHWREFKDRVLIWDDIVQKGCPEDLAFLCAFSFHGADWPYINTNHNSVSPKDPSYWHNFINRRLNKVNTPFKDMDNRGYRGIGAMWGVSDGTQVDYGFHKLLLDSVAEKEPADAVVIKNPFTPVVVKQTILTKQQLLTTDLLSRLIEVYGQKVDTSAFSAMPLVACS